MCSWQGINRRKFPRVQFPCLVVISNEEEEETLLTHTENIGIGGVCVILKKKLKIFSTIKMEIDLMDFDSHIQCEGKVVWCVQRKEDAKAKPLFFDTGIEFVGLNERDTQRIEKVVAFIVKKQGTAPQT